MRSAVSRHCSPWIKAEASAARQGALDCPNDTGSMIRGCTAARPTAAFPQAAQLTTCVHFRQRVVHHRLACRPSPTYVSSITDQGVAIRQRSERKSVASPVGPYIVFAQDEFAPAPWLKLVASARVDAHNQYGTFFSLRRRAPIDTRIDAYRRAARTSAGGLGVPGGARVGLRRLRGTR